MGLGIIAKLSLSGGQTLKELKTASFLVPLSGHVFFCVFFLLKKTPYTRHIPATYLLGFHSGLCSAYPMCLMKLCKLVPNPSILKLLESDCTHHLFTDCLH